MMRPLRPLLSVIVIAYDMPREIPRTIRSLSPGMQRGIRQNEYEIVVVDNGSTRPFAPEGCACWGADVRFLRMVGSSSSPVTAINKGLDAARGELVGVMIDGARMASPGLLHGALLANRVHDRAVIASLGFHLGPDVQMASVAKGYNQQVEDRLLEESGWMADGYRLFEVSVFAGSSAGGWFAPRVCELPDSQLIVLLGEGRSISSTAASPLTRRAQSGTAFTRSTCGSTSVASALPPSARSPALRAARLLRGGARNLSTLAPAPGVRAA